jgi:YHS domain-containing protein/thiol-disulfide isomerase/thioredoxin
MGSPRVRRAAIAWLAVLAAAAPAFSADVWRTDYAEAVKEAEHLGRPLLVHFYGNYCPPCRRMEREVLHTAETCEVLHARFVAVKVDAGDAKNEQNMRLVQRFDVHALPCDIVLDAASGRVLSVKQGFQDQRSYVSTALESSGKFEQSRKTQLATRPRETDDSATGDSNTSIDLGSPQPLVGLEGFSPVALSKRKEWIRGNRELAWEHKGITYYLATRDELELFRAKPEDYAPKLLGCDPVVLWETDRAVPGDTRYGAFFDGELYLFQTADTRTRFKANPSRYTRIQHVLKVDKLERTIVR